MSKRGAVFVVTQDEFLNLRIGRIRLPENVQIVAYREEIESDTVTVRVEGSGLPDFCETGEGQAFPSTCPEIKEENGVRVLSLGWAPELAKQLGA